MQNKQEELTSGNILWIVKNTLQNRCERRTNQAIDIRYIYT